MPVFGAIVTLPAPTEPGAPSVAEVIRAVAASPGVAMVGEPTAGRLPLVIETDDRNGDELAWNALVAIPGVMALDLAFADFSDLPADPSACEGLPS